MLPNYTTKKDREALDFITDIVVDLKKNYKYPYLWLTGDCNQWKIDEALAAETLKRSLLEILGITDALTESSSTRVGL